jgi:hypothetical protein
MELAVELAVQQAKWADALILAAQVSEGIAAFMRFSIALDSGVFLTTQVSERSAAFMPL